VERQDQQQQQQQQLQSQMWLQQRSILLRSSMNTIHRRSSGNRCSLISSNWQVP
jgi:hypothetical protein